MRDADAARPDRWDRLGQEIRVLREASDLSMRRLAARSGVSNPYLSQIERGLRCPSGAILRRIADALDVDPQRLFVLAGILAAPSAADETDAVIGALRADPDLDPVDRDDLIDRYRRATGRDRAAGSVDDAESSRGAAR